LRYDKPQLVFSTERRRDWRCQARAYPGLRQFRIAGFSPSVEYQFIKVDSTYDLCRSYRHRFQFKLGGISIFPIRSSAEGGSDRSAPAHSPTRPPREILCFGRLGGEWAGAPTEIRKIANFEIDSS